MELVLWTLWILVLILSIILPVYLGIHYLVARDCHPHIRLDIDHPSIQSFLPTNLETTDVEVNLILPENITKEVYVVEKEESVAAEEDMMTNLLVNLYPPEVGVLVGNKTHYVSRLPRTLYRQGTTMAKQSVRYSLRDVSALCTVNDIKERGIISLGLAVCRRSLLGSEEVESELRGWLGGLEDGLEDKVVEAALQGDLQNILVLLPDMFPDAGLNNSHVKSLQDIVKPFKTAELTKLVTAFSGANLTETDIAVLSAVMAEASDKLSDVGSVLSKIDPDNLGPITQSLDNLGIGLSDFITNPALFFKFFGDPEKSKILITLQNLLPKFVPDDIEAFLVFSNELEKAQKVYGDPDDVPVMTKLFRVPLDVLLGALPKLKLDGEARFGMEALQLLMEDDNVKQLMGAASKLQLLKPEVQQQFISSCTQQQFKIQCKDTQDRCPSGHIVLGLACLLPLIFPGLIYAISTILHYRGTLLQCGIGKPFNLPKTKIDLSSAWVLLLPIYLVFMIPWTLILIVYRQSKVWVGLIEEARGLGQPLEPDCQHIHNASSFGLLLGAGQGVLHLGLQAVILGVVLLAGDFLLGIDKEFYFSSTLIVTSLSLVLVLLTLAVSHLSSQECCRLSVDLATPPRSAVYLVSSLVWLVLKVAVTVASTLILALLVYIDTVGFSVWRWSGLSLVLLLPLPIIQCVIYQLCVRTGAEHRFAWGLLASIIPVRFLDMELRRARLFLILSQSAWAGTHVMAWVVYAVFVHVTENNDVVWRTWIPVAVPAILIPPLVAGLHWAASLAELYSATHAHPDMEEERKRRRSFPPDWTAVSGSSVSSESLAQAGFFYSCRRLKSGEATCYSCGRQVFEWSARTAQEAHRSVTSESCPLYEEEKTGHQVGDISGMSSSCIPQFIFISITILFRIASILLFIWVFWDAWGYFSGVLPALVLIPLLWVVVSHLLNAATYYAVVEKPKVLWSLASTLVPNPNSTLQYMALNLGINTLLHVLLWSAMLGTSPAVYLVAWTRLESTWPALLTLLGLSLLSTVPYWYLTIKPAREQQLSPRTNNKTVYVVSTSL